MITTHILVKGFVQGVFYRRYVKQLAEKLNILGYVKNLQQGDVEIVAQGSEEDLLQFISLCKLGPQLANVKEVIVKYISLKKFSDFSIRY